MNSRNDQKTTEEKTPKQDQKVEPKKPGLRIIDEVRARRDLNPKITCR